MANYSSSMPVKEVPGFARVGEAFRRGVRKLANRVFGAPGTSRRMVSDFLLDSSDYGLMAGPAALGRVTAVDYHVPAPLKIDTRFLGQGTIPLRNAPRTSPSAFVPKNMFAEAPGHFAFLDDVGNVIIPADTQKMIEYYAKYKVPITPVGSQTSYRVPIQTVSKMVDNIAKADATRKVKAANLDALNAGVDPFWQHWMYQRDIASLNATLRKVRAPKVLDAKTGKLVPVRYEDDLVKSYDVLSSEAARTMLSELPGVRYQLSTPGLGSITFSPNHVSAMSYDRFHAPGSPLPDLYNAGFLPYQSASFIGDVKVVKGEKIRPVMRLTDHHEATDVVDETISQYTRPTNTKHNRFYHVGREIPIYGYTPTEPGTVSAVFDMNGENIISPFGRFSASVSTQPVRQASKGGDSPHKNFRNFLASDKVPDSIFGFRIVQRPEDYSPEDVKFFRENPKAAGFYDTGDETLTDVDGEEPPAMDLFGGDTGVLAATAAKRKAMVQATAERQYKALLKFKDPAHRKSAEQALYSAIDRDARNAALLDEYNRLSEVNRPKDKRAQPRYDELVAKGRERYKGGEWERTLGELTSPDWKPQANPAPVERGQSFGDRVKEAATVAKELPGLLVDGVREGFSGAGETVSAASAILSAPKVPGVEVYDPLSGKIREGATGRVIRNATDQDREDTHGINRATGFDRAYHQDAKGGRTLSAGGKSAYGLRPDGTPKGSGWLGEQKLPNGGVATEYSIGVELDGKEVQIPTLIPTLTPEELHTMTTDVIPNNRQVPEAIVGKAVDFAKGRMVLGLSPFKMEPPEMLRYFKDHVRRFEVKHVEPYEDNNGEWAIGYGSHYLADGTKVTDQTKNITDDVINGAFEKDLELRNAWLGGDPKKSKYAIPGWAHMSPESRLMLLDVSWGRKDTLTDAENKSKGLFKELRAAGRDRAKLDDAVRRHYVSYRKARDKNDQVDERYTAGLQNRRIALLRALTGREFSYEGKKWDTDIYDFVEVKNHGKK